uniref:Uncharacterized protein n=1 Tax=Arundo donax TaxID=35708 RepID=A0A0A8Y142_ARUDO
MTMISIQFPLPLYQHPPSYPATCWQACPLLAGETGTTFPGGVRFILSVWSSCVRITTPTLTFVIFVC